MAQLINLAGRRFGKWRVLNRWRSVNGAHWLCVCRCGRKNFVAGRNLRRGDSRSCSDCSNGRFKRKHGMWGTPTYNSWISLLQRCLNPHDDHWPNYGGRNIRVTKRWQGPRGFQNFLADVGIRPAGKTLDRIDNDGHYTPSNCRWATPVEQNNNRRHRSAPTIESEVGIAA